jgi:hypothetical protein
VVLLCRRGRKKKFSPSFLLLWLWAMSSLHGFAFQIHFLAKVMRRKHVPFGIITLYALWPIFECQLRSTPSYPWLFTLLLAAGILSQLIDIGLLHPYNPQMKILKRVLHKPLHYRIISNKSTSWSIIKIDTLIITVFVVVCMRISPVRAALGISRSLH